MSREKEERGAKKKNVWLGEGCMSWIVGFGWDEKRKGRERSNKKKKRVWQREGCRGLHLSRPRMIGFYSVLFLNEIEFLILIFKILCWRGKLWEFQKFRFYIYIYIYRLVANPCNAQKVSRYEIFNQFYV